MSLKDSSPNDTYINLILAKPGPFSIDDVPYAKVDITEQVLKATNGFGTDSIIGVEYQTEERKNRGNVTLYTVWDLKDNIVFEMERLLDASIVNEKQKKALKELLKSRIIDVFDRKTQTFNLAQQMLK